MSEYQQTESKLTSCVCNNPKSDSDVKTISIKVPQATPTPGQEEQVSIPVQTKTLPEQGEAQNSPDEEHHQQQQTQAAIIETTFIDVFHLLAKTAAFRQEQRRRRHIRITGLLFSVTSVFILSWIPPYIAMVKAFYIGYR